MQQINMRLAHERHARRACKIAITRQPTREWCCMKSHFSATNKDQPWKKQDQREPANHSIPEPHRGVGLHASSFHRDLKTPWKHLTQRESAPFTPGATLGSGAALKLTPPKPEKSAKEPETGGGWTTLTPRARLGRGAAHTLIPPSPENSVKRPGTAREGTPLTIGGRAGHRAARKLTLPTANSGAGLGTEGACPPHLEPNQGEGTH
ncbi:hypothetical protein E2C01_081034 [Portunus trituberculatus]|uniref:Uncharacterized protein n=1 Tax=Portunus trituberculatus TaxID=210409 RepID=A0A5B7J165_PORTR|nr:hypothetical protein [Portunus trituberculatus]